MATECDADFDSVSLLLHMDGVGSTFVDSSATPKVITAGGTATQSASPVAPLFGAVAGQFGQIPPSSLSAPVIADGDLDLTTGDWTIEGWFYSSFTDAGLVDYSDGGDTGFEIVQLSSSTIRLDLHGMYGDVTIGLSAGGHANQWQHVVVCREGDTVYGFVDGVKGGVSDLSDIPGWTGSFGDVPPALIVGSNVGSSKNLGGAACEFRVTKGIARYTANFTPPDAPYGEACATCDPYYGNVVLHLPFDGTDGSTVIPDVSDVGNTVNVIGTAQLSTDTPKFGSAALELDGGGRISALGDIDSEINVFAGGDFTIEFFLRSAFPAIQTVLDFGGFNISDSGGFRLYTFTGGGTTTLQTSQFNGWDDITSPEDLIPDEWNHIAITRVGSQGTLYINGVGHEASTANWSPADLATFFSGVWLGGEGLISDFAKLVGSVDAFRVTRGLARYTEDFTPPADPFLQVACSATVPDVVGELLLYAAEDIEGANLVVGSIQYEASFDVPAGVVISQVPVAGEEVATNTPVNLVVSLGVPSVSVTAVLADDEAVFLLEIGTRLKFKEAVSAPPLGEDGRSKNMILGRYNQVPGTLRRRGIIYEDFLLEDEVITGIYAVTVAPVTDPPFEVTSVLIDPKGKKLGYYSGGGVDGVNYNVAFAVKTNANQTREDTVVFSVQMDVEED